MADYYSATVWLPIRKDLDQLKKLIDNDIEDEPYHENETDGVYELSGSARWGRYRQLHEHCVNNKIPYDMQMIDEDDMPFMEVYRPEIQEQPFLYSLNSNNEYIIPVKPILDIANELFDKKLTRKETLERLNILINNNSPTKYPKLSAYAEKKSLKEFDEEML